MNLLASPAVNDSAPPAYALFLMYDLGPADTESLCKPATSGKPKGSVSPPT